MVATAAQIHTTFRGAREARRLGLIETAHAVDMDVAQLSRFERGLVGISTDRLLALCDLLGIDTGDLPDAWRARKAS